MRLLPLIVAAPLVLPFPTAHGQELPAGTRVDTVARGLDNPWSLAFLPGGRLLLSQRSGAITLVERDGRAREWLRLTVAAHGAGLLGLAASPGFARDSSVFVVGSFARGATDSTLENRLLLLKDSAGSGVLARVLLGALPSARAHGGSAVAFGPDGKLYVTLGDAFRPDDAQDLRSFAGKILRLEPDGTPAPGNPFPGSAVFALGLRNTQGLAWEPATGALFATDHGPSARPWEKGRRDQDELNVIVPGGNYGWPIVTSRASDARFIDPVVAWTPAIAPSGAAFYRGPYTPWSGQLLIGTLRGRHLRRLEVRRDAVGRWTVAAEHQLLAGVLGRIRSVFVSPEGDIYLTASDRRSGTTRDDLLIRMRLPPA